MKGHKKGISCIKYNERSNKLISGGFDCRIIIWDVKKKQMLKCLLGHSHYICSIQIESSGEFFYTIGRDNCINEWNINSYTITATFKKYYSNTCNYSFTLTPCEKFIASVNFNKNFKVDMFNIKNKEFVCDFDDFKAGKMLLEEKSSKADDMTTK